jgi:hypothetical protein
MCLSLHESFPKVGHLIRKCFSSFPICLQQGHSGMANFPVFTKAIAQPSSLVASFSDSVSSVIAIEEAAEAVFPLEVGAFPMFVMAAAAVFADEKDSSNVTADIVFSDTFGGECCKGMLPRPIKPFLE